MTASGLTRRAAALALLLGLVTLVGLAGASWLDSYADGQHEIEEKQAEARDLRELAQARMDFARLTSKASKTVAILPAGEDAEASLAAAVGQATDGQQVVVDGIEPVPSDDAATVVAAVHMRGTQNGIYSVLRALDARTPYLLVSRLELTLVRAADLDRNKPLILSSDLRVAALAAPAPPVKGGAAPAAGEPAP